MSYLPIKQSTQPFLNASVLMALTRAVSPALGNCELTFREREPIDADEAVKQHEAYCDLLRRCGVTVITLPASASHPDCCFVEDAAIVVDELAIIAGMGVASRCGELPVIVTALAEYRELVHIGPRAKLEGGDVIRIGKNIFVGLSMRSDTAGVAELRRILQPFGYQITPVRTRGSLHLTTACGIVNDETLLVNPHWIDIEPLKHFNLLHTPDDEPWSANTVRIGDTVCLEQGAPRTLELVSKVHSQIETLAISEFRKAEGSLSCLSLLFEEPASVWATSDAAAIESQVSELHN